MSLNCAKGRAGHSLTFSWSHYQRTPRLSPRWRERKIETSRQKRPQSYVRACVMCRYSQTKPNPSRREETRKCESFHDGCSVYRVTYVTARKYLREPPHESVDSSQSPSLARRIRAGGFTYEPTKLSLGITYRRLALSCKTNM